MTTCLDLSSSSPVSHLTSDGSDQESHGRRIDDRIDILQAKRLIPFMGLMCGPPDKPKRTM